MSNSDNLQEWAEGLDRTGNGWYTFMAMPALGVKSEGVLLVRLRVWPVEIKKDTGSVMEWNRGKPCFISCPDKESAIKARQWLSDRGCKAVTGTREWVQALS